MLLKIVQVGDAILRGQARALSVGEIRSDTIRLLIEMMRDTMRDAPGVGLAAPQIGVLLQLAVIEDRAEYQQGLTPEQREEREREPVPFHVIINPKLTLLGPDDRAEFFEGCLSMSGFTALVSRARRVRLECLDETAKARVIEASGWYARILQHEIDHLQGTIYIDRMYPRSLTTVENFNRHWKQKSTAEIRRILKL